MHVMHLRWNEGTTKNFLVVPSLVAKQPSLTRTIFEYECKAPLLSSPLIRIILRYFLF